MARAGHPGMRVRQIGVAEPDGQTESTWGLAEVLVKSNAAHGNVVVNEFLANRTAIAVGAPVALGEIWMGHHDGAARWVTAAMRQGSVDLPPVTSKSLAQIPDRLRARMLCFDALVLNVDRWDGNVLTDGRGNGWLIDHEQAFFGDLPVERRREALLSTKARAYSDSSRLWVGQARPSGPALDAAANEIRARSIVGVQEAAQDLVRRRLLAAADRDAVVEFVSYRRDNIRSLIDPRAINVGPTAVAEGLFAEGEGL